jgi:hypothetical protein
MPSRIVRDEHDRALAATWISNMKPPFRLSAEPGSLRSLNQNALSFKWYSEAAEQHGDMTANEVRAECKLVFGVPILREENATFREVYDRVLKPLPYETKVKFIEQTELPVTSIMTMKQLSRYLDAVFKHFTEQGVRLTLPEQAHAA